jgi:hypothetical protein
MTIKLRSIIVLAGVAVLAASSQAVITFSNYGSQFTVTGSAVNQINATPPALSNFPHGIGTVTNSGTFDINSTKGISQLDVNEVDGFVMDGSLSLTVTLYKGADASSGVMETLYTGSGSSASMSFHASPLLPLYSVNYFTPLALTGEHLVSYSASFTGSDKSALGYLGGFALDGYEAVPEPAAYATLGLGVIGLLARRRRSAK